MAVYLGLNAEKIDELLVQNGVVDGERSAETIRAAIANVIVENNRAISNQVTKAVSEQAVGNLMKDLRSQGKRF